MIVFARWPALLSDVVLAMCVPPPPTPPPIRLPYPQYFGGVVAVTPDQYRKMNGFSNQYWGWGREDDDLWKR